MHIKIAPIKLHYLTLVITLSRKSSFEIAHHSNQKFVNEGQAVKLFCYVQTKSNYENANWKTCTWSRNSDGANCRFVYMKMGNNTDGKIAEFCSPSIENYRFFGKVKDPNVKVHGNGHSTDEENQICGISIPSANRKDNADWTCTIMQCKNHNVGGCGAKDGNNNTVEATINVEVLIL